MKTSKDKAFDMVLKYVSVLPIDFSRENKEAIECAKIAVDEIINSPSICEWENEDDIDFGDYFDYWEEVKNELNKMS